jgi:hypothetical protein
VRLELAGAGIDTLVDGDDAGREPARPDVGLADALAEDLGDPRVREAHPLCMP